MTNERRRKIALLVDRDGALTGPLEAGGRLRIEDGVAGGGPLVVNLPALPFDGSFQLFATPPFDELLILWSRALTPRQRILLGDVGVLGLRAGAPLPRILEVSRRWVAHLDRQEGEPVVPAFVRIGAEEWDLPAGIHMIDALEMVGAAVDRNPLCFRDDCGYCEGQVQLPGRREERRRFCRLSPREGLDVRTLPEVCSPPAEGGATAVSR